MNQNELARRAGYGRSAISMILKGHRRPSPDGARRLAAACPGTDAMLWLYGTPKQMLKKMRAAKT